MGGVGPGRGRVLRAQVLVLATLVALVVGVGLWLKIGDGPDPEGPEEIAAALAERMRVVLEGLPAQEHEGHGGPAGGSGGSAVTVCGTRVYGYEPADADATAEVVTVYGYHLCGVAEPGRTWDWAPKLVAPLVMRLDTQPPSVQIAAATDTVSYRDRVRQLIPPRYQKTALEEALGPKEMADLRRRYDLAAGL